MRNANLFSGSFHSWSCSNKSESDDALRSMLCIQKSYTRYGSMPYWDRITSCDDILNISHAIVDQTGFTCWVISTRASGAVDLS